jgi:hypothetical protein
MRLPAAANKFYPGNEKELMKIIECCFTSSLGPGKFPEVKKSTTAQLRGFVVPHAGYTFSGSIAAHAYAQIAAHFPDTFIILGPNHTGMGAPVSIVTDDVWQTPLGDVNVDTELAQKLCTGVIEDDVNAHIYEHSIEVHLPFLQHLNSEFTFVPICMAAQDYQTALEVGEIIAQSVKGKSVVVIASTDFSHYVPKETAEEKDKMAIDAIIALNPGQLVNTVYTNDISMCGYGPVVAMLHAVKGKEARLLKYATSGDVMPMAEVVGYASIVVE